MEAVQPQGQPATPALGLRCFADVAVVPVTKQRKHIAQGGAIWPDFADQTRVRHCRAGLPVDAQPPLPDGEMERLAGDALWGGFLDSHFGHFMAEQLPRLPMALQARPADPVLFTLDPPLRGSGPPAWMWEVLGWVGLARGRVRLVTAPVVIARLWAAGQAEMLPDLGPSADYLDLLDQLAEGRAVQAADLVYVTRSGIARQGGGANAGEGYLTELLQRLGIAVLDPARADIEQQMAVYGGAGHLIFAEGSALHGRQLLGRVPQRISVLRRRRGRKMAAAMLGPRVAKLSYHDVTSCALVPQLKNGTPRPDAALALYDLPALFAIFARFGIDLAGHWDASAYVAAALDDVAGWRSHHPASPAQSASFDEILAQAGLVADAAPPPAFPSRLV